MSILGDPIMRQAADLVRQGWEPRAAVAKARSMNYRVNRGSEIERDFTRSFASAFRQPGEVRVAKTSKRLYHGGIGGLEAGDILRPPAVTGYLRPQEMYRQAGVRADWLLFKETYQSNRVYCTPDFDLALHHAAGISNWMVATGAADSAFPRYGAVYAVGPLPGCPLEEDIWVPCCCSRKGHNPWTDPCSYAAERLYIVRVCEQEVPARVDTDWRALIAGMQDTYAYWKRAVGGGDDWWSRL